MNTSQHTYTNIELNEQETKELHYALRAIFKSGILGPGNDKILYSLYTSLDNDIIVNGEGTVIYPYEEDGQP